VRHTGERARTGLEALARQYSEILKNVRGAGVMLGLTLMRAGSGATLSRARVPAWFWCSCLPATGSCVLSALRHRAGRDRRGPIDPASGDRGPPGRARRPGSRYGAGDPRRHTGHSARYGRDRGSHASRLRDAQASDPGRRAGAATARWHITPQTSSGGTAALLQSRSKHWKRRPRARARSESRCATVPRHGWWAMPSASALENMMKRVVRVGSSFRREQHILLARNGHAAHGAELVELEKPSLESLRRVRSQLGSSSWSTLIEDRLRDTGPAWLHRAAILFIASTTTWAVAVASRTFKRCNPAAVHEPSGHRAAAIFAVRVMRLM